MNLDSALASLIQQTSTLVSMHYWPKLVGHYELVENH